MLITFFNNYIDENILREHIPNVKIIDKKFVFTYKIRLKKRKDNSVPFLLQRFKTNKNYTFGIMYDLDISEVDFHHLKDVIFYDYSFVKFYVYGFNSSVNEFINNNFFPTGKSYKSYVFVANEKYKHMQNIKEDRHININYNKKLLNELLKGGLSNELG